MVIASQFDPIMILGCGRSGTSIFGELFDGLASYQYESEPPFSKVVSADFSSPLAFKVPTESPNHPCKPGLSFPLNELLTVAPSVKIFWIIRHPLDAICSLKVGISNGWGHHPRPPDWQAWLERPLIEQCAYHWMFLNSSGFSLVEDIVKLVKFEKMIADPLYFAKTVCRYAGIDVEQHHSHIKQWSNRVQNSNNELFVEAETSRHYSREDHTVRVSRWRENLVEEEAYQAWDIVKATAQKFGYEGP